MSAILGRLPIVLTSAQQISADNVVVLGVVWIPSATSHSFVLSDNQNNVVSQGAVGAAAALFPIPIMFPEPIPCSGLVLKAISNGDTLLVYLA